jgi:hypothetical protein
MGDGRALGGMDIFGGQDKVKLAFLLDNIAFAHRAGDNRNHGNLSKTAFGAEFAGGYSREA